MSSGLWAFYQNINPLLIGKMFSAHALGYYTFATRIVELTSYNITGAIQKVSFSTFSKIQDDADRLLRGYRQIIQNSAAIIFPLMTIMAIMAEPLFKLLLNEEWMPAVPYLRILCIISAVHPLRAVNMNIIQVKGTPGLFSKISSFNTLSLILILFILVPLGIKTFLTGQIFHSIAMLLTANFFSSRLINYPIWEQLLDIAPLAFASFAIGIVVYLLMNFLGNVNLLQTFGLLVVAIIIYTFTLYIFKIEIINKLFNTINLKLHKNLKTMFGKSI